MLLLDEINNNMPRIMGKYTLEQIKDEKNSNEIIDFISSDMLSNNSSLYRTFLSVGIHDMHSMALTVYELAVTEAKGKHI